MTAIGRYYDRTEIPLHGDEVVTVEGANCHIRHGWCGGKTLVVEPPPPAAYPVGSLIEYPVRVDGAKVSTIVFHRVEADHPVTTRRLHGCVKVALVGFGVATCSKNPLLKIASGFCALLAAHFAGALAQHDLRRWEAHHLNPTALGIT